MAKFIEFNAKSLCKLGDFEERFNELVAFATRDCLDRPGMEKPREILVKIKLTPDKTDRANVLVSTQLSGKRPVQPIDEYRMATNAACELSFQPAFPMEPDQSDMFGDGEEAA